MFRFLFLGKMVQQIDCRNNDGEWQPRFDESPESDVLSKKEHPDCDSYHVPGSTVIVSHQTESHSAMRVTVIPDQIVHPLLVLIRGLTDCIVPRGASAIDFSYIEFEVTSGLQSKQMWNRYKKH